VPLSAAGTQVIRCAGCGAALQVSVRPLDAPRSAPPENTAAGDELSARPRRRPMVEVSGPLHGGLKPAQSFTVELSQSDIDTEGIEAAAPRRPPPAAPPVVPPPPPAALDTPWFAEDIERLPEANASLGQLALETFEALPPLRLRPDVPPSPRPPTAPASPARDK
jgi:hypothetical protein